MKRSPGPGRRKAARRVWLEFKLPEDAEARYYAEHGAEYRDVLAALRDRLRAKRKYETLTPEARVLADELWDLLWDELGAQGLRLDVDGTP